MSSMCAAGGVSVPEHLRYSGLRHAAALPLSAHLHAGHIHVPRLGLGGFGSVLLCGVAVAMPGRGCRRFRADEES